MNTQKIYKSTLLALLGMLMAAQQTPTLAYSIIPAQKPLYVGTSAALPNIMLMIDDSGSMSTSVTETVTINGPQDMPLGTSYNCSSSNYVTFPSSGTSSASAAPLIKMIVSGTTNKPQVCTNATCTSPANFGNNSGAKCFQNNLYYQVTYYNGAQLGTGAFLGLNLNWYFSTGKFTSANSNLLSSSNTITSTRIQIAKNAGLNMVASLTPDPGQRPSVRMGLATYYNGTNGDLLSAIDTLDSTKATNLNTAINSLTANGVTPLATTLADIGRYFALGYNGNLNLHPSTTNVSASQASIFNNAAGTITGGRTIHNSTGSTLSPPVQNYCQKNFVILISDGLPNGDREISSVLRDYTGDCARGLCDSTKNSLSLPGPNSTAISGTGTTCTTTYDSNHNVIKANDWYYKACKNGVKVGRKYETGGSDYLDDVAQALFEMDLRPDILKTTPGQINNLVTYAIGFNDPSLQTQSVLNDAATKGGGRFFFASASTELASALDTVIVDISSKVGSSSSVAANSSKLNNGAAIYQAKFDSADWSGSLTAYNLTPSEDTNGNGLLDPGEDTNGNGILDGGAVGAKAWDAATKIPAPDLRNIYTYNGAASTKGIPFKCTNLTTSQKTALGIVSCSSTTDVGVWRLDYLRGKADHEQPNAARKLFDPAGPDFRSTDTSIAIFRNRTHFDRLSGLVTLPDPWILGDIVNSDPVFVSAENSYYDKLPATAPEGASYSSFVASKSLRRPMLYIGANDGMFHGYDANLTTGGTEMLAYVPNNVYSNLTGLTTTQSHEYFVDGSPRAGDAYFAGTWHTVVVNSTGAGGKAWFALDITNPDAFTGSNVLWEISDVDSTVGSDLTTDTTTLRGFQKNMGWSLPQASVVKMNNGSWAAIIPNGYGSINNKAVLYVVDIQTGAIIKAFDTGQGGPSALTTTLNGLSTPIAVDTDGDKMVDAIYAGDLLGNMWKFDVKGTSSSSWNIANSGNPLFIACTDPSTSITCNNSRQAITAKPQVGKSGSAQGSGVMVYFGTGKYFEDIDNNVLSEDLNNNGVLDTGEDANFNGRLDLYPQTQTFYGIWDNGAPVAASSLQQQVITTLTTAGGFNLRVTTNHTVNYPTQKGWYMNLLANPAISYSDGERQISAPLLRNGRIIFTTITPVPINGEDACGEGSEGTSWLMELDALTGSRLPDTGLGAPWDINHDGQIDSGDLIDLHDGKGPVSASGKQSTVGSVDTPGVVSNGKTEYKYTSGSNNAQIETTVERGSSSGSGAGSRQSWQQL